MTVGDLFAGIGGMSLGLERAGFTIRWQVEVEAYCENVLARHWPDVLRRRDVRFAGAATLPPVDLIAGGFPCQDISAAGRGIGIERGHRSGLWREFARIVRELRPSWVLIENVPALRSRGADRVLGDLEAAGYACWPLVVGARHVGAPHRRDRVWIVGYDFSARLEGAGEHLGADSRRASSSSVGCSAPRTGTMADGHGYRRETERSGGLLDGKWAAPRYDADRFPAGPGSEQRSWEQPRTAESPLGRPAHGVSARLASARWRNELRALGNAVVPAVVEVFGRAILDVEQAYADEVAVARREEGPSTPAGLWRSTSAERFNLTRKCIT